MTTIALLGGIYSNNLALAAALADAQARHVNAIYCLGDLGAFGPDPDLVFPLLQNAGVISLQGNYDHSIGNGLDDCQCGYTDPRDNYFAQISYDYTLANTRCENKAFLRSLPRELRLTINNTRILLCHGSPRQTNEFLWESTTSDAFLHWMLREYNADVVAATHTGIKWQRSIDSGLFVNVGVLGRPENDGATNVWYTLLTIPKAGPPVAEFVPVEYDAHAMADRVMEVGLPLEFAQTLRTGWWTTCLEALPSKERLRGRY